MVASEICHQLMKSKNHKEITELIILDSPFYLNHEDIDLAQTREKMVIIESILKKLIFLKIELRKMLQQND
ncbi:hypothetical protein HV418_00875 [Enterococcus faecium]|nr:hypothetical protein [Enterococcus faecium]